jgi:hypothetical protein
MLREPEHRLLADFRVPMLRATSMSFGTPSSCGI